MPDDYWVTRNNYEVVWHGATIVDGVKGGLLPPRRQHPDRLSACEGADPYGCRPPSRVAPLASRCRAHRCRRQATVGPYCEWHAR